ncbi:hypothetical protein HAX54_043179, partial [Datura stramonium]|nr:hypothetical protein [Datura stramonium]
HFKSRVKRGYPNAHSIGCYSIKPSGSTPTSSSSQDLLGASRIIEFLRMKPPVFTRSK